MAELPTLYVCHGDEGGPRMHPCRRVPEASSSIRARSCRGSRRRGDCRLVGLVRLPAQRDDLLERAEVEDDQQRGEPDRHRHGGDADLLADRVGGDGRARRLAVEDGDQQRLLHAGATGSERQRR